MLIKSLNSWFSGVLSKASGVFSGALGAMSKLVWLSCNFAHIVKIGDMII